MRVRGGGGTPTRRYEDGWALLCCPRACLLTLICSACRLLCLQPPPNTTSSTPLSIGETTRQQRSRSTTTTWACWHTMWVQGAGGGAGRAAALPGCVRGLLAERPRCRVVCGGCWVSGRAASSPQLHGWLVECACALLQTLKAFEGSSGLARSQAPHAANLPPPGGAMQGSYERLESLLASECDSECSCWCVVSWGLPSAHAWGRPQQLVGEPAWLAAGARTVLGALGAASGR